MCILKRTGGAIKIKFVFYEWLCLRYVCKRNQIKTLEKKRETEDLSKGFLLFSNFFQSLYQT